MAETPTLQTDAQIRRAYASVAYTDSGFDLRLADFDRWLAAHDAQVAARTLREFANECVVLVPDDLPDDFLRGSDWGADECTRKAREEADRIAGGAPTDG